MADTLEKIKIENKREIIFGPILTRRLGYSLGIDLVPSKTCNMNCIYCECGATTYFTNQSIGDITEDLVFMELSEKKEFLCQADYITLTGSGEPTLNPHIGKIIKIIKKVSSLPIAILTNSTLLYKEEILNSILEADVVLPSLDAATEYHFKRINKPHPEIKLINIIEGIKKLVDANGPAVWLEIMLVKDVNDQEENLLQLKEIVHYIKPHKVQLNTPVRPGTSSLATPLPERDLIKIGEKLNYPFEIISFPKENIQNIKNKINFSHKDFILNILKRRPMTLEDIINSSGLNYLDAFNIINDLIKGNKIIQLNKEKIYYFIKRR